MYITPHHLNALCQDLTGQTAGELIRDRVVLEAKRLLVNDEMTAAEIAWNLNFKDASYFNRFFKKQPDLRRLNLENRLNRIDLHAHKPFPPFKNQKKASPVF
ncbi:helix-turn-helix transcriptional regulator [Niabella sp. W65]|nr:helix-turn-helix transcriptional regulator [Niabella sp. W65]MCH7368942.1 helix-turn-helix transcriptional regulator [Niabella sp. W65]